MCAFDFVSFYLPLCLSYMLQHNAHRCDGECKRFRQRKVLLLFLLLFLPLLLLLFFLPDWLWLASRLIMISCHWLFFFFILHWSSVFISCQRQSALASTSILNDKVSHKQSLTNVFKRFDADVCCILCFFVFVFFNFRPEKMAKVSRLEKWWKSLAAYGTHGSWFFFSSQ